MIVAQERTLARAAERLHLSQPAVSKTLAELEALADRQLVERGRSGSRLTQAGEQFLRYAVDVTQAHQAAAAALTGTGAALVQTVQVGALPTVAGGLLAQAIARLRERRPHTGVGVQTASNPELLAALKSGEVDFAVGRMAEPAMMQGVSFELLYPESLVIVARPQHPLLAAGGTGGTGGTGGAGGAGGAGASSVSPFALLGYPLVIPGAGTVPRTQTEGFFEAQGIALPLGCTETQSVSVARALTLLSDAVWITPQHAVQLDLDRGWLARLNVPVPASAEPIGLLVRSGSNPSELAGQLIETLRECSRQPRRPP